tara:strand:+ start:106 stop:492 length:387 start_codon:yes stop_codon:yes gene_type:complete
MRNKQMSNDEIERVSTTIKFIGKIGKNQKIDVKSMYLQPNTFITSIIRMLYKLDNRQNTLELVQNTVDQCLEIIENDDIESIVKTNFLIDLEKSKEGIRNLKFTYAEDTMFCCHLESIIQRIDSKYKK